MKQINVPTRDQVDAKANAIFDNLEKNLGMVPNLYATIGYASDILEGYLQYASIVGNTSFSKKEIEAIKLAVSEVNECEYCKAAHTALAQMNGFTKEDTISIRSGVIGDQKLDVIINLAQEIAIKKGRVNESSKDQFFQQGFTEAAFVELIAVVNVVSFTNFIHNATQVPVDFPAAPPLLSKSA